MKKLKIFILISIAFLFGALVATGLVWYHLVVKPLREAAVSLPSREQGEEVIQNLTESAADAIAETTSDVVSTVEESVYISIEQLPDAQRQMLSTFGIEGTQFEITPSMQTCAETKLGATRLAEIVAGDTPGVLESTLLLGCLRE